MSQAAGTHLARALAVSPKFVEVAMLCSGSGGAVGQPIQCVLPVGERQMHRHQHKQPAAGRCNKGRLTLVICCMRALKTVTI